MTVRRYSTNCSLAGVSERERGPEQARRGTTSGWGRLQEEIHLQHNMYSTCTPGEEGLVGSRRSLQEYVHKTRSVFTKPSAWKQTMGNFAVESFVASFEVVFFCLLGIAEPR